MDIIAILQLVNLGSTLAARGAELVSKLREANRDMATEEEAALLKQAHEDVTAAYGRLFPGETPPTLSI